MPFQKNKGFMKIKRDKVEQLIYTLRKRKAMWCTAEWCGYCILLKKTLNAIDTRLLDFIEEDQTKLPKGITGCPALYIPSNGDIDEILIPGYMNEEKIFKLLSQLS